MRPSEVLSNGYHGSWLCFEHRENDLSFNEKPSVESNQKVC